MTASFRTRAFGAALLLSATLTAGTAMAAKVAVITPYLAQPGTQFYVEAFEAAAKGEGWDVNVIDTKGDVAAVVHECFNVLHARAFCRLPQGSSDAAATHQSGGSGALAAAPARP